MNYMNHDIPLDDERLMSRLVEGTADAADWARWSEAADGDLDHWRMLAQMQADHGSVQRAMARASEVADTVALPMPVNPAPAVLRFSAWSGWAMAAMVALAAIVWHFNQTQRTSESGGTIVPTAEMTASEAFDTYIQRGRDEGTVVNELPTRVLVDAREAPEGGYHLLYLRQVLERVHVPDLYMIEDEPTTDATAAGVRPASYTKSAPKRGPM